MTDLSITQLRRSRYIHRRVFEESAERNAAPTWKALPGFGELVSAFLRNKVQIKYSTAYFDPDEAGFEPDEDDEKFILSLYEFCDTRCTGLWTMHRIYHRNREFDKTTHTFTQLDSGKGTLTMHFEMEADVQMFIDGYEQFRTGVNTQ